MLLSYRCVWNAIEWVGLVIIFRQYIKAGLAQTGEVSLYACQQSVVAEHARECERRCEGVLFGDVRAHQLNVGTFATVRLLVVAEEGVVRCVALVMHVCGREIQFGVCPDRQSICHVERETIGLYVLCSFSVRIQIEVVGHCSAVAQFVHSLCANHEFVVLGEWIEEIHAHSHVVHSAVHAVGYAVLLFHFCACQSVFCLVHGIHFRVLCRNHESDVAETHRTRTLVTLITPVSEL